MTLEEITARKKALYEEMNTLKAEEFMLRTGIKVGDVFIRPIRDKFEEFTIEAIEAGVPAYFVGALVRPLHAIDEGELSEWTKK